MAKKASPPNRNRAKSVPKKYRTSIPQIGARYTAIPPLMAGKILNLQQRIGMPVCVFRQNGDMKQEWGMINHLVRDALITSVRYSIPTGQKIALLVDSPGGIPRNAFQIATALRQHCGGYDIIVPKYGKSAATLLALGADNIILGDDAELGPIDMQVSDPDIEDQRSALEYVQSLERLEAYTLRFFDDAMTLLLHKTDKRVSTLLPDTIQFVTNVVRPLFENVDVVQYTQMARLLKVMEDYASRLLSRKYRDPNAVADIATELTSGYADHSFVIDREEAESIGLEIAPRDQRRDELLTILGPALHVMPNALGFIEEYV